MALFQYLVERIVIYWKHEVLFSEWHLFCIPDACSIFPNAVCRNDEFQKSICLDLLSFLVCYYENHAPRPMASLLIDSFLGLVSMAFSAEMEPHPIYTFLVRLTITVIVHIKDAGMLFAGLIKLS